VAVSPTFRRTNNNATPQEQCCDDKGFLNELLGEFIADRAQVVALHAATEAK
jgi:hypothetical protein